jgi:hypothetical protein
MNINFGPNWQSITENVSLKMGKKIILPAEFQVNKAIELTAQKIRSVARLIIWG